MLAEIEGDVHAELGAGVEQTRAGGILAEDAGGLVRGDAVVAVGEAGPGLAEVVGAVEVGGEVAEQVAVDGDVGGAGLEVAGLDVLDASAGFEAWGGDVRPVLAVVLGDVNEAVVRAGPDEAFFERRLADGVEGGVHLFAGGVAGDGLA